MDKDRRPLRLPEHVSLDGVEMDLSLQGLQTLPIRDMMQYNRLLEIDLSNNLIRSLPEEFPDSFPMLHKLDLSRNLLVKLPDNLGVMRHLRQLDLYSNKLERLPMSMSRMAKLRWLDVKDNPLVPPLARICGPCLDSASCYQCAGNLVAFMRQVERRCLNERDKSTPEMEVARIMEIDLPNIIDNFEQLPSYSQAKLADQEKRRSQNVRVRSQFSHADLLDVEEVPSENPGSEGSEINLKVTNSNHELKGARGREENSSRRRVASEMRGMTPRSKTGIHTGARVYPPEYEWPSWFGYVTLSTIRAVTYALFFLLVVTFCTAIIVDYRIVEAKLSKHLPTFIPMGLVRAFSQYQSIIQSFVIKLHTRFPLIPYMEPTLLTLFFKGVGMVWTTAASVVSSLVSGFSSFVSGLYGLVLSLFN